MQVDRILDILENNYPDAECELNYETEFELLIATILSAQCTDVRVNKVTKDLFNKYNKSEEFAGLEEEELQEIIKSCGLYKSKAKKIIDSSKMIVNEYNGKVPNDLKKLIKLPGVGRKTANVVLSNAFDIPAMAVDTHVLRVSNRIGLVDCKTPEATEIELMRIIPKYRWTKAHHLLIFHGRRTCKARKPDCDNCSINKYCRYYNKINI